MGQQAASFLESAVLEATGAEARHGRLAGEPAGVHYRLAAGSGAGAQDGALPATLVFFHVESRSMEAGEARPMADAILTQLGERCRHVLARHDWTEEAGRPDEERRTVHVHGMTIGLDAEG